MVELVGGGYVLNRANPKYLPYQTINAMKLKFWKKVYFPPPLMLHVSHVTCHVSYIHIYMSVIYGVPHLVSNLHSISKKHKCCTWQIHLYLNFQDSSQVRQRGEILLYFNIYCSIIWGFPYQGGRSQASAIIHTGLNEVSWCNIFYHYSPQYFWLLLSLRFW